uniref:Uncharacterized protein n=1 Tax=Psilocybe cubensis TaxID=181762 RepID=A0A8H7XU26_PSICU
MSPVPMEPIRRYGAVGGTSLDLTNELPTGCTCAVTYLKVNHPGTPSGWGTTMNPIPTEPIRRYHAVGGREGGSGRRARSKTPAGPIKQKTLLGLINELPTGAHSVATTWLHTRGNVPQSQSPGDTVGMGVNDEPYSDGAHPTI